MKKEDLLKTTIDQTCSSNLSINRLKTLNLNFVILFRIFLKDLILSYENRVWDF